MRGEADLGALKNEVYIKETEYQEFVAVVRVAGVGAKWSDPQPTREEAEAKIKPMIESFFGAGATFKDGQYHQAAAKPAPTTGTPPVTPAVANAAATPEVKA